MVSQRAARTMPRRFIATALAFGTLATVLVSNGTPAESAVPRQAAGSGGVLGQLAVLPVPDPQVPYVSEEAESSSAPLEPGGVIGGPARPTVDDRVEPMTVELPIGGRGSRRAERVAVGPVAIEVLEPPSLSRTVESTATTIPTSTPVSSQSGSLRVAVLGSEHAEALGGERVAFTLSWSDMPPETSVAGGLVQVVLDYSAFVDEFGADWAGRLRLVEVTACERSSKDTSCGTRPVDGAENRLADKVIEASLRQVDSDGGALPGYRGGSVFRNAQGRLPSTDAAGGPIIYREWDVNPYLKGVDRGAERLVTGSDGSAYFTRDHYGSFVVIRSAGE